MAFDRLDSDGLLYLWQKIKNVFAQKTDVPTKTSDLTNDSDFVSDANYQTLKNKVNGIASGAEVNVQADWNESDSSSDAFIKNKPTIPAGVSPATQAPAMDGTAAAGTSAKFAREDHVHPSDTAKVDKISGKGLSTNDFTDTLKDKLDGIASGAEVNQNAFSNVKIGSTTIAADGKTDTLELVAGTNVTLTPDASGDKVTFSATDTTYTPASTTPNMDGTGAVGSSNKYAREDHVHPTDTSRVPTTRKINNKPLSGDITLTAGDVSAIPASQKGSVSGVCPLDANGLVDSSYLPSFVDDVIEAYPRSGQTALSAAWLATGSASGAVITPETGKIYILMTAGGDYSVNTQFRWGGSAYVKMLDGGVAAITNAQIDAIVAS